ncbi:DMT family transporter [Roseibacterium beibuensis]|uniref:DMT family transporter n=1 Tax=[Roseibacterium] beibuensis TaxID=1193142 RepID=A0ABP9KTG9_9RHOB|nr:DMT family transporter [Roseibacterium beibuensis]MCS6622213.1 DMT family transporter [Roseibacterium beibuensis]
MSAFRLSALVTLAMLAFAANSILNRAAVGAGEIDALSFAIVRAVSGALVLSALVLARRRCVPVLRAKRVVGAGSLTLYLLGFSIAYVQIDAGLGALILFGAVQVTMFAGGVMGGDRPPARRWIGAGVALGGLAWLIWPAGSVSVPPIAAAAMLAAGIGWGVYSLAGRGATDPLAETAANFAWAAPLCLLPVLMLPASPEAVAPTDYGLALAVISGAVTSGLGYALWYRVLPRMAASVSGLVQLSVPVIAAAAGVILLGEILSLRMLGAGALTLGGIAYGLGAGHMMRGSRGS